ncbi:MliC family protein [Sinisalibacter aestuarii]|uniref:DUF1311 domain-containing protein n=1 Tax=Sinisalibacter aestuarii TaxID=2949426 RepID=A0ABQ5LVZ0_9RHOB|nr:MliC family protein [Sinisalibacter aestuarii]GKY88536.1 hypothetical protein STA1M1_24050 [Sinisalibacter aestuarii]
MKRLSFSPALIAGLILSTLPARADGPSFDCARAENDAEKAVCANANLAALDREVARLYALAAADSGLDDAARADLTAYQRGWIKGRDACWKADDLAACVAASYAMRIDELRRDGADAAGDDPDAISFGPVAYACAGIDGPVSATFINGPLSHAWLRWGENGALVTIALSGSGARYTGAYYDGPVEFWTKGDTALLTLPDRDEAACAETATD